MLYSVLFTLSLYEAVLGVSVSGYNSSSGGGGGGGSGSGKLQSGYGKSSTSSSSSSHGSKKNSYSSKVVHSPSSFGLSHHGLSSPLGYRYKYASDYAGYTSSLDLDPDLDPDFHDVDLDLNYDPDLDLDFNDVDLDLDLLKLKYGLYGLNHYSLRSPNFNDYRFRRRLRLRRRPYYRTHHRYYPRYWKHDLDFWGLDNYGLGFGYDRYFYGSSLSPTSYVHFSRF